MFFLIFSVAVAGGVWVRGEKMRTLADKVRDRKCSPIHEYVLPKSLRYVIGVHCVVTISEVVLQDAMMAPYMADTILDDENVDFLLNLPDLETVWVADYSKNRWWFNQVRQAFPDRIEVANYPEDYTEDRKPINLDYDNSYSFRHFCIIVFVVWSVLTLFSSYFVMPLRNKARRREHRSSAN